jgi:GT2 family glycosyltransferase
MRCPKVSIIILNMNGKEVLRDCLRSIQQIDYPHYDVIVVDNNSSDGSQAFIKETFPETYLMENEINEGIPEGQNIGIRAALQRGADYIFTSNNDVILDNSVLRELLKALEHDRTIGIAGAVMYSMEDPARIEYAGGNIDWIKGKIVLTHTGDTEDPVPNIRDVDYVSFFLADPRTLQSIGLFDKRYFAYWEETDLCLRMKKAGFRVVCVSTARVWHKGSYTAKKTSGFWEYYYTRNKFWFFKKYATRKQLISFVLYFFSYRFWRDLIGLLRRKNLGGFKGMCRGVLDGLLGRLQLQK